MDHQWAKEVKNQPIIQLKTIFHYFRCQREARLKQKRCSFLVVSFKFLEFYDILQIHLLVPYAGTLHVALLFFHRQCRRIHPWNRFKGLFLLKYLTPNNGNQVVQRNPWIIKINIVNCSLQPKSINLTPLTNSGTRH